MRELPLSIRELRGKAPFVRPSAGRANRLRPFIPPRRYASCNRLDDQYGRPFCVCGKEPGQQLPPGRVRELVDSICGQDSVTAPSAYVRSLDRQLLGAPRDPKHSVRPARFGHRPRMAIDASDAAATFQRPRRSRGARPAAEIQQALDKDRADCADDFACHEEMKRPVEERERGALTRRVERSVPRELRAALDVTRRQRSKRARHFRRCEVGQVALVERLQPLVGVVRD
jgi:hypothetical protein